MSKNKLLPLLSLCCAVLLTGGMIIYLWGGTQFRNTTPVSRTGFAFDTVITITVYDSQKTYVLEECIALCSQYEQLFSTTVEGSDIWNINHSYGRAVPVSFETACLLQSALFYCSETDGMLDLTLLPVSEEWRISEQMTLMSEISGYEYYIPSSDRLAELIEHVNYNTVELYDNNGTKINSTDTLSREAQYQVRLLDTESAIDLGFIAKGYIADALKDYMVSEGVESGIISLGGNVLLIGAKPDNSPFHIGIQKPFGGRNELIDTIEETDCSIVSSGCYERYFISDNTHNAPTVYHHILDAATGYPVQNDLLGVTVLSDSSLQGDVLSTYCYILGLDRALAYIRSLDGVGAVFVTKDFEVVYALDSG